MIILVTGGRDYTDRHAVLDRIAETFHAHKPRENEALNVWHGGAKGADDCAHWAAGAMCAVSHAFHAEWEIHGRKAGPLRNERMVSLAASHQANGHTVVVLAFPGGKGTADCVRRATAHGLRVVEVTP